MRLSPVADDRPSTPCQRNCRLPFFAITFAIAAVFYPLHLCAKEDECARTANMQVYSDAFLTQDEAGDLVGFELALRHANDSTVTGLLFVYEGSAADGISLPGHLSGETLSIEGNWDEHLIEYPSKKETTQTHHIKINGRLKRDVFQGTIEIGDITEPQKVRLKRVKQIWVCKR